MLTALKIIGFVVYLGLMWALYRFSQWGFSSIGVLPFLAIFFPAALAFAFWWEKRDPTV